jgi:hypothetical protein
MMSTLLGALLLATAQAQDAPEVDEKSRRVSFPAVALKTEVYADLKGVIEYVVVNRGGKSYESLFEANVDARAVYDGLQKIGIAPGRPAHEEDGRKYLPEGGQVCLFVEWKEGDKPRREPIETFVLDTTTGKAMTPGAWFFTGSKKGFVPELERQDLLVLATKNLVTLHHADPTPLLTNPVSRPDAHRYRAVKEALLKEGSAVRIVLEASK